MAPAIRKEGARSKLVFDTENSLKPGTITAQAGASSAGIGSVFYFMTSNTMGNITFNGGDIKAYIRDSDGAAIGGGDYSPGSDITISGGYIQAQGGKDAPGIGVKKRETRAIIPSRSAAVPLFRREAVVLEPILEVPMVVRV